MPPGCWTPCPAQLGAHDDLSGFTAHHPVVGELALRYPGLRVGRTGRLFEALVPAVLEQKVVGVEAHRAWRILLGKYGTPAPGPAPRGHAGLPPPRAWARIPSWDWHRAGVEGVRARTIITAAAAVAGRLEQARTWTRPKPTAACAPCPASAPGPRPRSASGPPATPTRSRSATTTCPRPSAGPWPAGSPTTPGMLELLAPYAGHRYRVSRLIELGGSAPPRRGPRMSVRDYRLCSPPPPRPRSHPGPALASRASPRIPGQPWHPRGQPRLPRQLHHPSRNSPPHVRG